MIASTSSGIWVVGVLLLVAAEFIALLAQSPWAGLAGLTLVVAHNVWAWRRVELWPIDSDSAKTAARWSWLAALAAWATALLH